MAEPATLSDTELAIQLGASAAALVLLWRTARPDDSPEEGGRFTGYILEAARRLAGVAVEGQTITVENWAAGLAAHLHGAT